MNFFVFDAIANSNTPLQSTSYSLVVMLFFFSLIFYFMILRPQKKRDKAHKELISSISKEDEVMTTGGLIGRVVKVMDTGYISIALNDTNVVVIKRDFITTILPKGTMKKL
ncbi:preprotein translocase subunit YajC [Candidatus Gullanella endobia]|uniref:Sec translocon accessory complex subunit YajC n=1 Tax=Candidatus Gullanella endobia TaxID=1070130 RepID=A0A143WQD4_9ENTR|nr:preprotein translocase subunit YajC [Candidatus Gullanella endobia]CUX95831.1 preprotein translocase subunit YajC [Candidatus Gullanella endobia]